MAENVKAGTSAKGEPGVPRPALARIAPTSAAVPEPADVVASAESPQPWDSRDSSSPTSGPQLE